MAIGAHPDDVEYSCFGLLKKLEVLNCSSSSILVLSNGCRGDLTSGLQRTQETTNSFKLLKNSNVFVRDISGFDLGDYEELSNIIRDRIIDYKPDLILIPTKFDTHQEHRLLHDIVITAARRLCVSIWCYRGASSTTDFKPNIVVDISPYFNDKLDALRMHKSQLIHEYFDVSHVRSMHLNHVGVVYNLELTELYSQYIEFA